MIVKPIAWKAEILNPEMQFDTAADAVRDRVRKHVGPDEDLAVEEVKEDDKRFVVAAIVVVAAAEQ